MKRVAVLGSTGMAGHVVATYLARRGYDVYRTSRSEKDGPNSSAIPAHDFLKLGVWLDQMQPEYIINCIGVLQRQAESRPDIAVQLNAYLPHWLEVRYWNSNVKIIHISTDCVFSGKRGGYTESDEPDGTTMYDRSKALGEIKNSKDLTFRMSIIGPDSHEGGTGLFHWFMGQKGEIRGFSNVIWNGVTTIELARAIDAAILQNLCGLYHLTSENSIDKFHLLLLFQKVFSKSDVRIKPYDSPCSNKTLVNTRRDFDFRIKPYVEQVQDMKKWVDSNRAFYGARYYPLNINKSLRNSRIVH